MNCSYCGTHTNALSLYEGDPGESKLAVFCGRVCLRAWLGPDRPLSDRVAKAQAEEPTPQHMVVCRHTDVTLASNKHVWCRICGNIVGFSVPA
jgi:hypothetical protein